MSESEARAVERREVQPVSWAWANPYEQPEIWVEADPVVVEWRRRYPRFAVNR